MSVCYIFCTCSSFFSNVYNCVTSTTSSLCPWWAYHVDTTTCNTAWSWQGALFVWNTQKLLWGVTTAREGVVWEQRRGKNQHFFVRVHSFVPVSCSDDVSTFASQCNGLIHFDWCVCAFSLRPMFVCDRCFSPFSSCGSSAIIIITMALSCNACFYFGTQSVSKSRLE